MSGPPGILVIVPGVSSGLDRHKAVAPVFVRLRAARSVEIGVMRRRKIVEDVAITPGGVRLPDLDQRVRDRTALFVSDLTFEDHSLTDGLARALARQIVV